MRWWYLAGLLALASPAGADVVDSLATATRSHRFSGDFPAALDAARRRAALLETMPGEEQENARRDVTTLRFLISLPEDDRADILRADAMSRSMVVSLARGDYARASEIAKEQLSIKRRILGEAHHEVALLFNSLAAFDHAAGDFAAAEPLLRESVVRCREAFGPGHSSSLAAMQNLASTLRDRGEFTEAESLYKEVIARHRQRNAPLELATSLGSLADLYQDVGKLDEAESLLRDALDGYRREVGEEHARSGETWLRLGRVQLAAGESAGAMASFRRALGILEDTLGVTHPRTGEARLAMGTAALEAGDPVTAREDAELAASILNGTRGSSHPLAVQAQLLLARASWVAGDVAVALQTWRRATAAYELARLRAGTGLVRSTFLNSPYLEVAAARLESGENQGAWLALTRHHGRGLSDLLRQIATTRLTTVEQARADSLQRTLASLERRVLAQPAAEGSSLRDRVLATEAAWSSLQRQVAQRPESESKPRLQLPDARAFIGWVDVSWPGGESAHWAFVVRGDENVHWVKLSALDDDLAGSVRRSLVSAGEWPVRIAQDQVLVRRRQALWDQRIQPLVALLDGVEQLVVLPSGDMVGLPLECLLDANQVPLAEHWSVTYVPSPDFLRTPPRRWSDTPRALLVADPPMGDTRPRLVRSGDEVQQIADWLPSARQLVGEQATEEALFQLAQHRKLQDFKLIHIATHATIDDLRPEQSALVLAQTNLADPVEAALREELVFDGLVTAKEIVREWRLDADLVTLSGCRTAAGRRVAGEGMIGFAQAFLQVGCRSLLLSLWNVDDDATAQLMPRFYHNLIAERMSPSQALRRAQLWVRGFEAEDGSRPYEHPAYWAGFVLVGNSPVEVW